MKLLPLFAMLCACTSLGPMPATMGVSAVPGGRPGMEAQVGAVPGYYVSAATHQPTGAPIAQLSGLVEPDRWLGMPGLIAGARIFGQHGDTYLEPYLGYRHREGRVSLAAIAFGTANHGSEKLATYRASRVGGEAAADVELASPLRWLGVHAQGTVSGTYLSASGTYCVDGTGVGIDCKDAAGASNTFVDGTLHGGYFAATGSIALDFGRLRATAFHAARLAALVGAGTMPRVRNGMQGTADVYTSIGVSLTVGFGATE